MFAKVYPFLEELKLKGMMITDESLMLLANSFPGFKALSLSSCDGFSENGLKAVTGYCRKLTELNIQESVTIDVGGGWLSCFPENFDSLEVLNFASLNRMINFDDLERLVSRCKSLRVLKVNEIVTLNQLQRLLVHSPQLLELGTGSFLQDLVPHQYEAIESAFSNCKNLQVLSGLWEAATSINLPILYGACANLRNVPLQSGEFATLVAHCPNMRRLWVMDTVEDSGLKAVGSNCPLLEELSVFPAQPNVQDDIIGVTELGFLAVSFGCRRLPLLLPEDD